MLDLVTKLAAINSGSFNIPGLVQVAQILRQEFAALNCEGVTMPLAPYKFINKKGEQDEQVLGPVLRFWKRPAAPFQVLLVGHMDTVYPPEHKFQAVTKIGEDQLNGPGVADMKGGLAIMLEGLKAFEKLPQAQNLGWEVIISPDEEIGSPGSSEIIENSAKKHQVGFVFEPAMDEQGTLAGARKGSGKLTLVVRGKAAHAGRSFDEGRNAIFHMAALLNKINELNGQRQNVTINAGIISGGEALNIVAECCVAYLDVRVPQAIDSDWVLNSINDIISTSAANSDYKVELHGDFDRKPKVLDSKLEKLYELVRSIGKEQGLDLKWKPSGGCCDGNNLTAVGLPNVDTLGVRGGKIHSDQEFLVISSLPERAKLLTNILVHLSEHGFNNDK